MSFSLDELAEIIHALGGDLGEVRHLLARPDGAGRVGGVSIGIQQVHVSADGDRGRRDIDGQGRVVGAAGAAAGARASAGTSASAGKVAVKKAAPAKVAVKKAAVKKVAVKKA